MIPFGSSLWFSNPMMRSSGSGEQCLMMIWVTEVDLDEVVDSTARLKRDHRTQNLLCLFTELEKAIERDLLGRIGPASEPLQITRQLFGDLLGSGKGLPLAHSDVGEDQICKQAVKPQICGPLSGPSVGYVKSAPCILSDGGNMSARRREHVQKNLGVR